MRAWTRGFSGPGEVLEYLRRSAGQWSRSPTIRRQAIHAIRSTTPFPRTRTDRATALLNWTRRNVAYVPDESGLETLQSPGVTLDMGGGDCDDHAALLGAMLKSTGQRVRLCASGLGRLSHVFPEVNINGKWLAVDSTLTRPQLGKRAPHRVFIPTTDI